MMLSTLPLPELSARTYDSIPLLTDEALVRQTGVRIAFTGREGGQSQVPYDSLNLGSQVGDDGDEVRANRVRLMKALGADDLPLIVPLQVHKTHLVSVDSTDPSAVDAAIEEAQAGADGVVVSVPREAALLCFADCVPVIIVTPDGRFAVVHAGWRGVAASIAPKVVAKLAEMPGSANPSQFNVYIGPHIGKECFQCAADVHQLFTDTFGDSCAWDDQHIDLSQALITDLTKAGIAQERIIDAHRCTVCEPEHYFSYRASGGTCGRQGALAFRQEVN